MQNIDQDKDLEIRSLDTVCVNESHLEHKWYHNLKYLLVGIIFGLVFIKAEIISWYRIQEMFRFQSFHMYGVIGSGVLVGMVSILIIKKFVIVLFLGTLLENVISLVIKLLQYVFILCLVKGKLF